MRALMCDPRVFIPGDLVRIRLGDHVSPYDEGIVIRRRVNCRTGEPLHYILCRRRGSSRTKLFKDVKKKYILALLT